MILSALRALRVGAQRIVAGGVDGTVGTPLTRVVDHGRVLRARVQRALGDARGGGVPASRDRPVAFARDARVSGRVCPKDAIVLGANRARRFARGRIVARSVYRSHVTFRTRDARRLRDVLVNRANLWHARRRVAGADVVRIVR